MLPAAVIESGCCCACPAFGLRIGSGVAHLYSISSFSLKNHLKTKTMKQLLAALILLCTFCSCEKETLTGSGPVKTEPRTLSGFSKIEVTGQTRITITQGSSFKVEVSAYNNLLQHLETKVVGDVLKIGYAPGHRITNDNSSVNITLPLLTRFATTGSSSVFIQSGAADNFEAYLTGASNIRAYNFSARNATVQIEGSGQVELSVNERLKAKITGSGSVYYKGSPWVTTDVIGSGKVEKR
jgi:hypothetical protein